MFERYSFKLSKDEIPDDALEFECWADNADQAEQLAADALSNQIITFLLAILQHRKRLH